MSVYIREIARELGEQGHYVDVYTRAHDPSDSRIVELGKRARLIHLKAGQEKPVHKLMVYSYLPEFNCNLESFRKENGLQYDLIYSHYWLSGWTGKTLQRWWQVPHAIMFHTLGAVKNAVGIGEDSSELRIVTEKEAVDLCQRVIVATDREKEELIQYYEALPDKIGIVPCGVNTDLFQPVDRDTARKKLGLTDDKIILFVGRIDPLKGVDRLIRSIPYLDNHKSLRLIIIGGDEYSKRELDKLYKLTLEMGLSDRVTFQGMVKQERLPYFYSAADVCAVPSYYESFGLVALESLACGTPVVATDVGDMKNIIVPGETGYVLGDNTPRKLADGIDLILKRPPRDMKTALSIRESISGYSWQNIAERVIGELRLALQNQLTPVA
jgi:D-inositol-3-phosphate glycosyltransferase